MVNPKGIQSNYTECGYCPYKGICGNDQTRLKKDMTDYGLDKEAYRSGRSITNQYYIDLLKKRGEM